MSAEGTLLADPTSCNYMYILVFMPVMPLEGRVSQWIFVCIADLQIMSMFVREFIGTSPRFKRWIKLSIG